MDTKKVVAHLEAKLEYDEKLSGLIPLEKYANAQHKAWLKKYGSAKTKVTLGVDLAAQTITLAKNQIKEVVEPEVKQSTEIPKIKPAPQVLDMAREFYTVEALMLLYQERGVDERYQILLKEYRTRLHTSMRYLFRDYILLSCFGEARHAGSSSNYYIPELVEHNRFIKMRSEAGKFAMQFSVESLRKQLFKLFDEGEWQASFGGKRWASAVKALDLYERPAIFLDHVFDLKHNGSSLFNKLDYGLMAISSAESLKMYLNKRFYQTPEEVLNAYLHGYSASEELIPLIKQVQPTSKTGSYSLEPLLHYQPIIFGERTLSEPIERPRTPTQCYDCGHNFFQVAEYEHKCYQCLYDGHCSECEKAYNHYHPKVQTEPVVQPETPKQKGTNKNGKRNKKDPGAIKTDATKLAEIATNLLVAQATKSVKPSKSKIKWDAGSTDYTGTIALKHKS